jgi:TonB-dependent starch-binding outer membrane protein SusC
MRKLVIIIVAFLLLSVHAFAQEKTVTGKVTDQKDGSPLVGVSVTVKGANTGTTTGADGTYSLIVPLTARSLVFSFVNFEPQEISIGSRTTIDVKMSSEEKALAEVVVVGYGTQKKKAVTAAIARINGKDIADLPTTSFDRQLAGRAAGVQVTQVSGLASAPPRIRIRGVNSISQGRDPLFVIDGIPTYSGGASGVANTNVLADINPNDIESIEVLKDGAATAIYGSRAANGVVIINTKKGKSGKLNVNYDAYVGISSAFNSPDLLNAEQFVTIANEKLTNAGLAAAANLNSERTNTNWLNDVIYRNRPIAQSHTLSVAGGNEKSTYYMSINYLKQDGIIRTNFNNRYNIRANMEHKANSWLKIGNNITLGKTEDSDQNNGGNALSSAMGAAMRALPNVRVKLASHPTGYNLTPTTNASLGRDANTRDIENNYVNIAYVLDNNRFLNDRYRIINNFFVELSPIRQLQLRSQASVDYTNSVDFQSLNAIHGDGRGAAGSVLNQNIQFSIYTWQNYATFIQSFGDHSINVVGGVEMQRTINRTFFGQGTTLSDPFFQSDNLINGTFVNQFSGGGLTKTGFQSFFGRANYDYNSKYFASLSFRRDGSSRLAPDVRYGNFFGASAGWRVSAEDFWKNTGINSIVNDFKLRGGYAEVGNELTQAFPWLSTYGPAQYGGVSGNAASRLGNAELRWEENKKLNIGADLSFLNNRFTLSFDWFTNQNDGQVLDELQPVSLGVPQNVITKNIGKMENRGIEISLGGDIVRKKDFSWNVNANFTRVRNEVKSLASGQTENLVPGPNNGVFNINRIGENINSFFGYEYFGVNTTNGNPIWKKEDGSLVQYNNVAGTAAGYYFYDDKNPSALGTLTTLGNRYLIGNALPTWFGGITNSLSYKRITLDIFFRFSGGNQVYNLTRQEVWNSLGFVNNSTELLNRWTPSNTNTDVPKVYYGRDNQVNLQGLANGRFLEDADFLRLQNLTLSYNFGQDLLNKATKGYMKSLRFYIQGSNLAVWTKYSGIDPENFTELGIDNSSVPQLRTFTLGLNVGF